MSNPAMTPDRMRRAILLLPVLVCAYLALLIAPQLPALHQARDQLRQALHRQDVRILDFYVRGQMCGMYATGNDRRLMRFLIDGGQVWTGTSDPQGAGRDVYARWSKCVTDNRSRRGDVDLALWVLNRLPM